MTTTSAHGRPLEVELKYRVVEPAAADRYLAANDLAGFVPNSPVRSSQVEDRYIDTPDGALARAGFAARIRQTANATTVAVKSAVRRADRGSVHRREELEGPADRTSPPRDWPPSDARSLILEQCGDAPLVEVVTIRQLRRKRILERNGTAVEVSLDEVDTVTRSRVVGRFVELEVELLRGNESGLREIDRILADDPGLAPAHKSKLESALQAVAATEARKSKKNGRLLPPVDVDEGEGDDEGADAGLDGGEDGGEVGRIVAEALGATTRSSADAGTASSTRKPAASDPSSSAVSEPAQAERTPSPEATAAAAAAPASMTTDGAKTAVRTAAKATRTRSRPKRTAATNAAGDVAGALPEPDKNERPRLAVGKTPGVLADDHLAEAGRKVLRFHLARMIAREAGTREGNDPEDLHSMRVATRRQRAAWRIFGESFRPGRTKDYRRRLREVGARLGAVRDLDVLLEAADAWRADLPIAEQRSLEPMLAQWRLHREDARQLLLRELDSDGYRRWLDDYAEFVRHEGLASRPVAPTEPHRVRDTAASRIQAAYEQVRAYEPVLRWADVDTLHELRIAGKWLRYSLEFVREALGPDSDALIARVTALQDHLGLMHDADVSAHLARDFLLDHAGGLSDAESATIGRYLLSREREVIRLRRGVGPAWRGVAGLSFKRGLGRALAGL